MVAPVMMTSKVNRFSLPAIVSYSDHTSADFVKVGHGSAKGLQPCIQVYGDETRFNSQV